MASLPQDAPAAAPGTDRAGWAAIGLIAAAILVAYANTFSVPLLLDDELTVGNNPSIHSLRELGKVLRPDVFTTASRPLLNLTFALNYAVSGPSVWSYHVVNLSIHILAAWTLYAVVRRTLLGAGLRERWRPGARPLAALAAATWALHPLHTEAVTYLSQRAESLMGLCYLLTLYGFIRATTAPRPAPWYAGSILCCFAGMAVKEVMVTAPVVLLFYDRTFVSGSFRAALSQRRGYYLGLAASWAWLAVLMHRGALVEASVGFHTGGPHWLTYALTESKVIIKYLKLAFVPYPLVFDYGSEYLVTRIRDWAPYLGVLLALLVAAALTWRRNAAAGFAAFVFFILLAPTSSVVPIAGQPMAESRMYLPLAAIVVLVAAGGYGWGGRKALAGLVITGLVLAVATRARNVTYGSALSIWENSVSRHPYSSRAQINLAQVLAQIPGRQAEAVSHYEEAVRLSPDSVVAHFELATLLSEIPGRLKEAVPRYEQALKIKPDHANAHYGLANALARIPGREADALPHYQEALRLKPNFAEAHLNLACTLSGLPDRMPEALEHFDAALRIKPDYADARNNLAVVYFGLGRIDDAIRQLEQVLVINPHYPNARSNLEKLRAARK